MADKSAPETTIDIRELSADVGLRFSEVKWKQFNSLDMQIRNGVRAEVHAVTKDLMRIAEVEPKQAALIWDELVPAYVPRPPELPRSDFSPEISNTIEPGRKRRRRNPEAYLDPSSDEGPQQRTDDQGRSSVARDHWEAKAASPDAKLHDDQDLKAQRTRLLLEALDKLYHRADDKYHFKDQSGELAFEARDKKLVTHHESPGVIASMIDLAEARGWDTLRLTGTKEFRKEAWFQAQLRGLETTGYQPTQLDKVRLEEAQKERKPGQPPRTNEMAHEDHKRPERFKFRSDEVATKNEPAVEIRTPEAQALAILKAHMKQRGDSDVAIAQVLEVAANRIRSTRLHVGSVIETGTAPYMDKKDAAKSHFVVLEDDRGQRAKVWGVDLPRALEAGEAEVGAQIALSFRGRQKVALDVQEINPGNGSRTIRRELVDRNVWEVVRLDRLEPSAQSKLRNAAELSTAPVKVNVFDRSASPSTPSSLDSKRSRTNQREIAR